LKKKKKKKKKTENQRINKPRFLSHAQAAVQAWIRSTRIGNGLAVISSVARSTETEEAEAIWAFPARSAVSTRIAGTRVASLELAQLAFPIDGTSALKIISQTSTLSSLTENILSKQIFQFPFQFPSIGLSSSSR